jgi:hypothetical protein
MGTQEAISAKITTELELISERAALIPQLAASHLSMPSCEDEDLYDTFRNVAGALQLAIDCLRYLGARPATVGNFAQPLAGGSGARPWASQD